MLEQAASTLVGPGAPRGSRTMVASPLRDRMGRPCASLGRPERSVCGGGATSTRLGARAAGVAVEVEVDGQAWSV
jgi:hypothetical protein